MADQTEHANTQPRGSQNANTDDGSPDYRAHVRRSANAPVHTNLFERGDRVYLKKARSLQGPYVISAVHSDGTYSLSENGRVFNDSAREEDLQPV